MHDFLTLQLRPQQAEFVDQFVARRDAKTLLVAAPGMGKIVTARAAAMRMLEQDLADRVLFVAGRRILAAQWEDSWPDKAQSVISEGAASLATTHAALSYEPDRVWHRAAPETRWLLLFDEVDRVADRVDAIADEALQRFPGSRALFMASEAPDLQVDNRFIFDHAFFGRDALTAQTQVQLHALAPSIPLLAKVQRRLLKLDELNWRQFEHLIAQMLEADGYQIELMKGTKDGGVDVIAVRDLGAAGLFKSVWQAKKLRSDRKVGLSVVRELADTRLEHGASKAIIVTTSVLTHGALTRVERDRYLLGKIDRCDLDRWIERTLAGS